MNLNINSGHSRLHNINSLKTFKIYHKGLSSAQLFPNQDIEPKKLAAVCWTDLLSSLGDLLLLVLLWGSREMEEVDDEARTVLMDL